MKESRESSFRPEIPSFDLRIAHLHFEQRLHHNVEVELAKPSRKRVLAALNWRMFSLSRRDEYFKRHPSYPSSSYSAREANTRALHDTGATLHVVAVRTLCQTMMARLPLELREMIYDFLPTDHSYSPRHDPHVTVNALYCPGKAPWTNFLSQANKVYITDEVFMGEAVHMEFILRFYNHFRFSMMHVGPNSFPSVDLWNHGINPSRMIKFLTIPCRIVDSSAPEEWKTGIRHPEMAFVGPALANRREDAIWTLYFENSGGRRRTYASIDDAFRDITTRLSTFDIPNPSSVVVKVMNSKFKECKCPGLVGSLKSWINMYRQNAQNVRIEFLNQLDDLRPLHERKDIRTIVNGPKLFVREY